MGFSKVVALENADINFTINTIFPAYVKTPLVEQQISTQAKEHNLTEQQVIEQIMLDLSRFSDFELRDRLIDIFSNDEMWIWPLSDGRGLPPESNGLGDGGIAPAASSGSKPPPVAKTAKPKGGGVAAVDNAPAKTAGHDAKPVSSYNTVKLVDMPSDLIKDPSGVYGYFGVVGISAVANKIANFLD